MMTKKDRKDKKCPVAVIF